MACGCQAPSLVSLCPFTLLPPSHLGTDCCSWTHGARLCVLLTVVVMDGDGVVMKVVVVMVAVRVVVVTGAVAVVNVEAERVAQISALERMVDSDPDCTRLSSDWMSHCYSGLRCPCIKGGVRGRMSSV